MNRSIFLLLCSLFLFSTLLRAESLKLASDVWPPFTNHMGKTRTALNLVSEALIRGGTPSKVFVLEEFTAVTDGIVNKTYDGSAALWRTPERDGLLLFSEPYLENRLVLVGRKGTDVSAKSLGDLNEGSKVGLVEDYAYGEDVTKASGPEFIYGASDQDNLDKLLESQVDYILVDDLLISFMLQYQREEAGKFLQVGKQHMTKRSLHFAIRKETPGAQEIMEKFNTAITEMMIDGTYNRILKLQWIQADVDGDGRLDLVAADKFAGSDKPIGGYNVLFPDIKFEGESKPSNYYIDGKKYDGWDNIPNDYKIDATSSKNSPPPVNTFRFPY